jgi:hypothetical protein
MPALIAGDRGRRISRRQADSASPDYSYFEHRRPVLLPMRGPLDDVQDGWGGVRTALSRRGGREFTLWMAMVHTSIRATVDLYGHLVVAKSRRSRRPRLTSMFDEEAVRASRRPMRSRS